MTSSFIDRRTVLTLALTVDLAYRREVFKAALLPEATLATVLPVLREMLEEERPTTRARSEFGYRNAFAKLGEGGRVCRVHGVVLAPPPDLLERTNPELILRLTETAEQAAAQLPTARLQLRRAIEALGEFDAQVGKAPGRDIERLRRSAAWQSAGSVTLLLLEVPLFALALMTTGLADAAFSVPEWVPPLVMAVGVTVALHLLLRIYLRAGLREVDALWRARVCGLVALCGVICVAIPRMDLLLPVDLLTPVVINTMAAAGGLLALLSAFGLSFGSAFLAEAASRRRRAAERIAPEVARIAGERQELARACEATGINVQGLEAAVAAPAHARETAGQGFRAEEWTLLEAAVVWERHARRVGESSTLLFRLLRELDPVDREWVARHASGPGPAAEDGTASGQREAGAVTEATRRPSPVAVAVLLLLVVVIASWLLGGAS